jgi:NADH dehydrogenase
MSDADDADHVDLVVVTGAFSYTGKYVTRRLLARGRRVKTLTGHPRPDSEFGDRVSVAPLEFRDPDGLKESLRGASTLVNTYWVRFAHRGVTFQTAIDNTRALIRAAADAGVRRIVHVSITNPSDNSPLPYFRGKAVLERAVDRSGLGYAVVRPTVIFGAEDILINNIAWFLRRFPLFAVFGRGDYRLQPIFVEDMAEVLVEAVEREDDYTLDAVGPETYTFEELVRLIAEKIGRRARIIHLPPGLAHLFTRLAGLALGDVVLTRDEIRGLMANLLVSDRPPPGRTRLSEWLEENAERVGRRYSSELARHYR